MLRCTRCSSPELSQRIPVTTAPLAIGDSEVPILFVGKPKQITKSIWSSIARHKLVASTKLGFDGLEEDEVADKKHHGGPDRAILAVSRDTYRRLDMPERVGLFGENLSVEGFNENQVMIGDRFVLGSAVLEVNQPRSPCFKLDIVTGIPGFARNLQNLGCGGWFLRVLTPGQIEDKSRFELIARTQNALTVAETNCLFYHQSDSKTAWDTLMSQAALSESWRQRVRRRLQTSEVESWTNRLNGPA